MARLVVSAVVAVAAFVVSGYNPYVAFQAFALTYGMTGFLDPNKRVLGPKLDDLRAPSASYGSPIPYVEGAPRLAGVFFWASEKREIATTTTQGKGGPGVDSTTYTYEIDCIIGLAINECAGVRRIWSNGRLIWSNAEDADDETISASADIPNWRDMRFYSGDVTQLPDPVYEAAVGAGNAPAYRGRTTVFIEGLNLGGSGQLPILTFEVLSLADQSYVAVLSAAVDTSPGFDDGTPAFSLSGYKMMIGGDDIDLSNGFMHSYKVYDVAGDGTVTEEAVYDMDWVGNHGYSAMRGVSDVSVMMTVRYPGFLNPVATLDMFGVDGSVASFNVAGINGGFTSFRFAKRGDDFVIYSDSNVVQNDLKVRRYDAAGGSAIVASAALPQVGIGLAISTTDAYLLGANGVTVYRLDLATLTLQETITIPAVWQLDQGYLGVDDDGTLYGLGYGSVSYGTPLIRWNGSTWEIVAYASNSGGSPNPTDPEPAMGAIYQPPSSQGFFGVSNGTFWSQAYYSGGVGPNQARVRYLANRIGIVEPTLDQVVSRLCLRNGQLIAGDIDVTALASQIVRAMAITNVGPIRTTLDMLSGAYLFEFTEGEKLKCVPRGGAPALTIPYSALGASADGQAEPLPKKRLNEMESAAKVSVKFGNVLNDFQDGLESGDRLVTQSKAKQVIEIPLGMTPTEAKRLAEVLTMDQAVGLMQIGPINLGLDYAALEPTDVIIVTDEDGSLFRARITRGLIQNGIYQFELVLDDASVLNAVVNTSSEYSSSTLLRVLGATDMELMDIPILRDADDAPGIYGAFNSTGRWPGASIERSPDDVTYTQMITANTRSVMGAATTTLGDFTGGNVFDERNALTIDVDDELFSSTRTTMLIDGTANALLVGSEIIQFRTATLVSPGVYTLTGLLRGRRGTEWAMPGHVAAERVVLLDALTLRRIADTSADRNVSYYWKAITFGKSRASATAETFADTGVGLKPFAPVNLKVSSDSVVTWRRRSRLSSRLMDTTAPPLGESVESYDVELRDAVDALVDSSTVSTPSYSVASLVATDNLVFPVWGVRVVGGERIGVREDFPTYGDKTMASFAADGSFNLQSPVLGQAVYQWTSTGDTIYVVAADVVVSTPDYYTAHHVYRLSRTTLGTIAATSTNTNPGDYLGMDFDGTNVWVTEATSSLVRKLNATTLASEGSYAMTGKPNMVVHAGGKLYILCVASKELVRWDIATQVEDYRVVLASNPWDCFIVGSVIFVGTTSTLEVRNLTTGALIISHAVGVGINLPQRCFALSSTGDVLFFAANQTIRVLNPTTGAQVKSINQPFGGAMHSLAGSIGTDLYLTGNEPGTSKQTILYESTPLNMTGYSITVWQKSAAVGRGYPATLEL